MFSLTQQVLASRILERGYQGSSYQKSLVQNVIIPFHTIAFVLNDGCSLCIVN
jgi:hypothetical protein